MSFFSHMTVVPALKLGVFISTNTDTGGRLQADLAPGIVGRFYATKGPVPAGAPTRASPSTPRPSPAATCKAAAP